MSDTGTVNVNQLLDELTKTRSEAAKYRKKGATINAEFTKLKEEHAKVLKENEGLKANPDKTKAELDKTKSELRTLKHKGTFESLAKELKVRPEALGDLWSLSGYQAESDEPDAEAIKGLISKTVESRPFLVAEDKPEKPVLNPGPGLNKGGLTDAASFVVRRSDTNNKQWMIANQAKVAEAYQQGNLRWIDD